MTDPLGQSQVIPYLAGLTKFGYQFTILSCEKPEKYEANREYVQKLIAAYPIQWSPVKYHKKPPVLSTAYDIMVMRRTAAKLHRQNKFDLVHTRPGVPTITGLWMKKKFGIKFLNDIREFWADSRVDGGMWNISNPVYNKIFKFFKKHEDECLVRADYNSCLTYAAKKELQSWKHIPNQPLPIEVIPCSVDLELFNPEKIDKAAKEKFRKELNIQEGDFVISYLGSIGGWYLTAEMLRFCRLLSDKIPAAKFLFISPHRHDEITAAAEKYGLSPEKIITRKGMRHEVPVLLSLSQYSIFFIKPCYSKISSSPTKHGEIMAMGIPVITNGGVGDVADIVTKYNGGYIVDDFSDPAFERVIEKLISGNGFNAAEIRNGAKDFYALDTAVERYRKVYSSIFETATI